MARIISFAWTTPALVARRKTCTRRDWDPKYARRFKAGDLVDAYDRGPRHGGKLVARLRLTETPYRELTPEMPEGDWEAEGFAYLQSIGAKVSGRTPIELWELWRLHPRPFWVVRFEILEVLA